MVEDSLAHYREATSYLRTGNIDLAAIELENMADTWRAIRERFGAHPPDIFDGNAAYGPTLDGTARTIEAALAAIDADDPEKAATLLRPVAADISAMRRKSSIYRLGDCILDAGTAMNALFVYKQTPPDLSDRMLGSDVVGKAAIYHATLKRCEAMAPASTREEPEFRRLFDGADKSLQRIPEAVVNADSGLLYRLLIELRSFDRLIYFRYG